MVKICKFFLSFMFVNLRQILQISFANNPSHNFTIVCFNLARIIAEFVNIKIEKKKRSDDHNLVTSCS